MRTGLRHTLLFISVFLPISQSLGEEFSKLKFSDGRGAIGFGSSLTRAPNGMFLALTDRGPNQKGAKGTDPELEARIFSNPKFVPSVALFQRTPDGFQISKVVQLLEETSRPLTGLPPGDALNEEEHAYTTALSVLKQDPNGIDPEGIAVSPTTGHWWICDEYGPSLLEIHPESGRILRRLSPKHGLPEILGYRKLNRGFEGIAALEDGKILAALQSGFKIKTTPGKIKLPPLFLLFDPSNGESKLFLYSSPHYSLKIGDLSGSRLDKILAIENTERQGRNVALIVELDLTTAEDVSSDLKKLSSSIDLARKRTIIRKEIGDLSRFGWNEEKTEGLVPTDDGLLISADDDFEGSGTPLLTINRSELTKSD